MSLCGYPHSIDDSAENCGDCAREARLDKLADDLTADARDYRD